MTFIGEENEQLHFECFSINCGPRQTIISQKALIFSKDYMLRNSMLLIQHKICKKITLGVIFVNGNDFNILQILCNQWHVRRSITNLS